MHINIVSFNVPYPADYGGVIDVFYKLKSLHGLGVKIVLHTFEYGREHSSELERFCEKVYYYKRKTGFKSQFSSLPYIVKSRSNKELLENLLNNDYPILFEGLHTCYYLNHAALKNRLKIVRPHNIEHLYYQGLAATAEGLNEKIFFSIETNRLKKFEKTLNSSDMIIPLSNVEKVHFETLYGNNKVTHIPIFHQNSSVRAKKTVDNPYLLFHGDLSVAENSDAVNYLIKNIAQKDKSIRLVIAGKNPSNKLIQVGNKNANVDVVSNPCFEQMQDLIENASINVLYAKHGAGVKLKLLNSLFLGRYCLANHAILEGSGLDELCIKFPNGEDGLLSIIHEYNIKEFGVEEKKKRQEILDVYYNNESNAQKILDLINQHFSSSRA